MVVATAERRLLRAAVRSKQQGVQVNPAPRWRDQLDPVSPPLCLDPVANRFQHG